MTPRPLRSLRARLTVLGFVAIYAPVLILLAVTVATTEDTDVSDGAVEVSSTTDTNTSGWVIATVVALAPVAAAAAWWLAGRAVRPIDRVRRVAEDIEANDLSRRIDLTDGPTEIVALATSFDSMLDRLEDAASTQQRLIEEASHELRTPLTVLTTNADVVLDDATADPAEYRAALERSRAAATRMAGVIEELLVDARGRARTIDKRPADLVAIVRDAVRAADPSGSTVTVDAPDELAAAVDSAMVGRAVGNLIDNAIRHSGGTAVAVEVSTTDREATVSVTDDGRGLTDVDRDQVFERFWRGDGSAGSGLGLPIARHVARAHGGDVVAHSPVADGRGARFELSLRR